MVLTKHELISTLQKEVRILVHLASKVDPSKADYRPSAKQRSIIEVVGCPACLPHGSRMLDRKGWRCRGATGAIATGLAFAGREIPGVPRCPGSGPVPRGYLRALVASEGRYQQVAAWAGVHSGPPLRPTGT